MQGINLILYTGEMCVHDDLLSVPGVEIKDILINHNGYNIGWIQLCNCSDTLRCYPVFHNTNTYLLMSAKIRRHEYVYHICNDIDSSIQPLILSVYRGPEEELKDRSPICINYGTYPIEVYFSSTLFTNNIRNTEAKVFISTNTRIRDFTHVNENIEYILNICIRTYMCFEQKRSAEQPWLTDLLTQPKVKSARK